MNVISAFGNQSIQDALKKETERGMAVFAHKDFEWQGEIISAAYEYKDTDVIMVYTGISGNMDRYTFVRSLVANATAEIILIDDDNEKEFKEYCASLGITITLKNGRVNLKSLVSALKEAYTYSLRHKGTKMDIVYDSLSEDIQCESIAAEDSVPMYNEAGTDTSKAVTGDTALTSETAIDSAIEMTMSRDVAAMLSKRKYARTKTIGVMGLKAGSGTTGTVTDICELLLQREKCQVAVLETGGTNDLKSYAQKHRIDYYEDVTPLKITANGKYSYAVIDFGAFGEFKKDGINYSGIAGNKSLLSEFLRCDLKLIICRGEEWDIEKLKTVLADNIISTDMGSIFFFLNGSFRRYISFGRHDDVNTKYKFEYTKMRRLINEYPDYQIAVYDKEAVMGVLCGVLPSTGEEV